MKPNHTIRNTTTPSSRAKTGVRAGTLGQSDIPDMDVSYIFAPPPRTPFGN